jgi:hypothetical protein
MVIAFSAVTLAPSGAQSSNEKPKATDVGVSATEIRIAVLADVDTPLAPGLFKGAVDGVRAAAKYLNSTAGGGGIAGRKVVVDFIDSKLNPTATRNGIITACQQDFAMVGSALAFATNVDDEVTCKDQAGDATGLPDLPAFAVSVTQSCSPVAFPVTPTELDCATKEQSPQTYRSANGSTKYLIKKVGKALHGAFLFGSGTKDGVRGSRVVNDGNIAAGIKADQQVGVGGSQPQSAYTPIVNKMKQDGSNFGTAATDTSMILLRSEAQLQGLGSDVVWYCGCYSPADAANPVLDGTWVDLIYLPVEEASSNPMLKTFLQYVGRDHADQFAVYAWAATMEFAEAAKAVVAKSGVNGLTRKALLSDGIPTLTKFDSGGMIGVRNIPQRSSSSCFVMMRIEHGKYVRQYPAKKGTFDCDPKNNITIKADYIG